MALERSSAGDSYLRPSVIDVDSRTDKFNSNDSDFRYRVNLSEQMNNVVTAGITAFNIGPEFAPTFYTGSDTVPGNNKIDFTLSNFDINGGVPSAFSVTIPSRRFQYYTEDDNMSLTSMLEKLIMNEINSDPSWEDQVTVTVSTHPEQKMVFIISSSPFLPVGSTTTMELLFDSGANSASNPAAVLGFDVVDYSSNTTTLIFDEMNNITQAIVSPNSVNLVTTQYVDIVIDQFRQFTPLRRIYLNQNTQERQSELDAVANKPPDLIPTDSPPRNLKFLDVIIKFRNAVDPSVYGEPGPHSFKLALVQLQSWPEEVPKYVVQEYFV